MVRGAALFRSSLIYTHLLTCSGFLGSKVVDLLTEYNHYRISNSLEPNEIILLSSSPGKMMDRLTRRYQNTNKLQHVRASRVDYYTQHSVQEWIDHLGSLGCCSNHHANYSITYTFTN